MCIFCMLKNAEPSASNNMTAILRTGQQQHLRQQTFYKVKGIHLSATSIYFLSFEVRELKFCTQTPHKVCE